MGRSHPHPPGPIITPVMSSLVSGIDTSNSSQQVGVIVEFLEALALVDTDRALAVFAKDYAHIILPKSLEFSTLDGQGWAALIKDYLKDFTDLRFEIQELIESHNFVTIHISSKGTLVTGEKYGNEYIFIFETTLEDGVIKLKRTKEFLDSKYTSNFLQTGKTS